MDGLLRSEEESDYLQSLVDRTRDNPLAAWGARRVGCTAAICLVQVESILVANVGDSRVVLSQRGQAVPLSEDHKPNLPRERERIERAGGVVEQQQAGPLTTFRINGNLNLSRSIGDLDYKNDLQLPPGEQIISSVPDVLEHRRDAADEFVLIASDGIWDRIGSQEAVDFVRRKLQEGGETSLSQIMEDLLDECFSPDLMKTGGLGGDNMTALLVLVEMNPHSPTRSMSRNLVMEKPFLRTKGSGSGPSDGTFEFDFLTKLCSCHPSDTRYSL
ncbi:unnamed protein product [Durusdinium trenchii]